MRELVVVSSDDGDWAVAYVDGVSAAQGHSLSDRETLETIVNAGLNASPFSVLYGEYDTSGDESLDSYGNRFPDAISGLDLSRVTWESLSG